MNRRAPVTSRSAWALAVLCLGLIATPSWAAGTHRVVQVHGTVHGTQPLSGSTTQCVQRGGEYDPKGFPTSYSGVSEFHGTLEGEGTFCGWIPPTVNPDGTADYIETDTFTGTISGCGRGTLRYDVHGRIQPGYDPARNAVPALESWSVLAGSGTGGLAGVTGGGRDDPAWVDLTPTTDVPPQTTVDTMLLGTLHCNPPRKAP